MKVRVGTDLVDLDRFRRKIHDHAQILPKIFTRSELQNKNLIHLAGVFAAKEAVLKALDLPPGSWLKLEVAYRQNGKPFLKFEKSINQKIKSCDLSITNERHYAQATFVAILK